jgi:hypothetical protein
MRLKLLVCAVAFALLVAFMVPIVLAADLTVAPPAPPQPKPLTPHELIHHFAGLYAVSESQMLATIKCESINFKGGQSGYPDPTGPNGREDSWGLVQIHLPDHPTITREQALNDAWAIEWMAKEFSLGHQTQWTCWRALYL